MSDSNIPFRVIAEISGHHNLTQLHAGGKPPKTPNPADGKKVFLLGIYLRDKRAIPEVALDKMLTKELLSGEITVLSHQITI